ncbi:MAG: hypothetical protein IKZ53_07690 [Selenomonadaceae bacterium]|nr:hypothetical protein [Selenomonadaceae bacterium]
MTIAIVDDEKIELETVETFLRFYIKKFWAKYESLIHIETFCSPNDFLTFFNPKFYQVIILGEHLKHILKFIGFDNVKILFIKPQEELL